MVSSITIGTNTTDGTTEDTGTEGTGGTTDSVPQPLLCSPVNSPARSPIVMRSRPAPGLRAGLPRPGAGLGRLPPQQLFGERPVQRPIQRPIQRPGTPGLAPPRVRKRAGLGAGRIA